MTITFRDFLREALLALFYGFMVFEKVWEERDGLLVYRKFASRHPRTVYRWLFDETGGIAGIVQRGFTPDNRFVEVEIPIDKLIVFTWQEEFGNPEGVSVFRPAYKHWKIKDYLYTIGAVAMERFGVGTPIGIFPPGGDRDMLLRIVEQLKSYERAGVVLPEGYKIELLEAKHEGLRGVLMELIEHCDWLIARAVLAQFMVLGAGETGSRALGQVQMDMFLFSLEGIADWLENTIQRYAVNDFVRYNAPDLPHEEYPRLRHVELKRILNVSAITDAIAKLLDKQALTWQRADEDYVRALLDLPPLPTETETATSAPSRTERVFQTITIPAFDAQRERMQLDAQQDAFQRAMQTHLESVWEKVSGALQSIIDAFAKASDLSKGVVLQQLLSIELPGQRDYERLLRQYLWQALIEARIAASQRYNITLDDPEKGIPNAIRTYINTLAATLARQHYEDARAHLVTEVLNTLRQNLPTQALLPAVQNSFNARFNARLDDLVDAAQEVIDLLNEGGE